jgi:hypothetical protein
VHDHLAERADLGVDAEAHGRLPFPRQASSDHCDSADSTEPTHPTEPTDSTDATHPAEPIDRIEPAEPIDKMDPLDPMDRIDPLEPMDRIDPEDPRDRGDAFVFRMESFSQRPAATRTPPRERRHENAAARHLSAWCMSGPRCTRC